MTDVSLATAEGANTLLSALGEQLMAAGASHDLVVIGGAALLAVGLVQRVTRDIDVLALRRGDELSPAVPFPPSLRDAADRVARDFGLPSEWINGGPTSLLELGLPAGFVDRLVTRRYSPALTVRFASRIDQIHFKLDAAVDSGPGKHVQDLRALEPTRQELSDAARWSRTHDPSVGYREMLERALSFFGAPDADLDA